MGPERIYPPRLRDEQAAEAERMHARQEQRKKRTLLAVGVLGLGLLTFLGYGLFDSASNRVAGGEASDPEEGAAAYMLPEGTALQVEVQNACGESGIAEVVAAHLRNARFDVPSYGNASEEEPFSLVLDRTGDIEAARRVAKALDIPEERVIRRIDSTRFVEATVLLGHDYRKLRPFQR